MKQISSAIDRFCRRHPRFGISRLMLAIVAVSAVVYLLFNTGTALSFLIFSPDLILRGQIWRLVTWVFLPVNMSGGLDGIFFTAIALYFYYFIGSTLEREWGTGRFTAYYLIGMLLHIVYGFIAYFICGMPTANAFLRIMILNPMYLNLSMFFAFAVLFPEHVVRLFFIIPIKIKWLALLNAALFIFSLLSELFAGRYISALLPLVALLNFFLMCGDELFILLRPLFRRASPQIINFKKEAKQARRNMEGKPYRHQCAVCGKTDTDHPEIEFRYCSLCSGYHCFCSEHINNHIHFT